MGHRPITNADFRIGASRLRRTLTPTPLPVGEGQRGFSLIELLVALAVFAALAAAAYGGLSGIARTRGALAERQDRLAAIVRAVSTFERDLRQAVSRPVRGARGEVVPALAGTADHIELTRLGFANPRAEPRSNLERVVYATDARKLIRGRYAVLDRAPNSVPATTALLDDVDALRLRYLGTDGAWRDTWPPSGDAPIDPLQLPRVIEFRIGTGDIGELRRVIELPTAISADENENATPRGGGARPPTTRAEGTHP
jgi:general secretion pathway protein J